MSICREDVFWLITVASEVGGVAHLLPRIGVRRVTQPVAEKIKGENDGNNR